MVRLKMGNLGLRSSRVVSGDGAAARRPALNGSPLPRRIDGAAAVNGDSRRTLADDSRTKRREDGVELSNGSHESLGKLGRWIFFVSMEIFTVPHHFAVSETTKMQRDGWLKVANAPACSRQALWVRIQTFLKNHNGRHKQRSGKDILSSQIIYKKIF